MTPLHMAAKRGCLEIVRYLIDQGAAVNIKDDNGVNILALDSEFVLLI